MAIGPLQLLFPVNGEFKALTADPTDQWATPTLQTPDKSNIGQFWIYYPDQYYLQSIAYPNINNNWNGLYNDSLNIQGLWYNSQCNWTLDDHGYLHPVNDLTRCLQPTADGSSVTIGPMPIGSKWGTDQYTPPPPPSSSALISLGVNGPWNVAWHNAQPAPQGGVQGQTWQTGPLGEGELVWNVPQDYQYWEDALNIPHGSMASSGAGVATDPDPSRGPWDNYEGSAWSVRVWDFVEQRNSNFWLNVPPFPKNIGATLDQVPTGVYDSHYLAVANQLASQCPTMVYRPMWEFEGDWYVWGWNALGQPANYPTLYINAFRHMVSVIRSVHPGAKFCWNLADASIMPNWQACYPGDDVVDWVAMDTYDGNRSNTTPADARWAQDQAPFIASVQQFAAQHNKGWAVPEFAIGKMGDNPLFITNMINAAKNYVATHNLPVFLGYWNNNDAYPGYMNTDINPQSWAAYIAGLKN